MTTLGALARIVRSKNAGPTQLTIDLLFDDEAGCARAAAAPGLTPQAVAALYGVPCASVRIVRYPPAHAIKIVVDRATLAGGPGDRDVYGAQQHGPLLDIAL
jgi:hypothetical protein